MGEWEERVGQLYELCRLVDEKLDQSVVSGPNY